MPLNESNVAQVYNPDFMWRLHTPFVSFPLYISTQKHTTKQFRIQTSLSHRAKSLLVW